MRPVLRRRNFLPMAAAGMTACSGGTAPPVPARRAAVAIVRAGSYAEDLVARLTEGIEACGLDVRGKRILLKPNLVEFDRSTAINTDAAVVAAAAETVARLGAAEVLIGEGPGHRRDAFSLAEEAGYRQGIPRFESLFVDLNRDDVTPVERFAHHPRIFLPNTALGVDLIISLAKMKTHHWAGATLSMKNLFGLVPGSVYGWPKNLLHYTGIARSVVELNRIFRKTFAIVDGITGMEGNGPIQGTPKHAGVLVMGRDLAAVDATCCRIMGIDPVKVQYLAMAMGTGVLDASGIEQRGEAVGTVRTNFALFGKHQALRLA